MKRNFGTYLKEKRILRGLTQKKLAEKVGVSATYIHQVEISKVIAPTREMCQHLASALKVSFEELWKMASEERFFHFAAKEGLKKGFHPGRQRFSLQDMALINDPSFGKIYYELQGAKDLEGRDKKQLSEVLLRLIRSYTS